MNTGDAWGMIVGFFWIIMLLSFTMLVLSIIARWKIFSKAGEEGIYSIIPVFNEYIFSKIVFGKGLYFLIELGGFILYIIGQILSMSSRNNTLGFAIMIIGLIIVSGYSIARIYKLGKCFNKSTAYSIIMAISPYFVFCGIGPIVFFIMYLNIAFGTDAVYLGTDDEELEEKFKDIGGI